jgi:hypothetical protein
MKAWSTEKECSTEEANEIVSDLTRFLETPGLKAQWISLCNSLSDTWPVVGLLAGMREVNRRHHGRAFIGMGNGLGKMIREPRFPGKATPTQLDSLLDLFLALSGPSDGLFTSLQKSLVGKRDLLREFGSFAQPNTSGSLLGYSPLLPNIIFGLFLGAVKPEATPPLSPEMWLEIAKDPGSPLAKEALAALYVTLRTAHEDIAGTAKETSANDYLNFNTPIYLNSFVFSRWMAEALAQNYGTLKALPSDHFNESLWDTKISVKPFELTFTETQANLRTWEGKFSLFPFKFSLEGKEAETVFSPTRLKELKEFGLDEFAEALSKKSPVHLGGFEYKIPATEEPISFREAARKAMEAIDQTRGYADSSSAVRALANYLISPTNQGKSFLESLESPDLLLSVHRFLSSVAPESWQRYSSVLFEGISVDSLNEEVRKILLSFYEEKPHLLNKFSRILDSIGMLKALDQKAQPGELSAFEAYQEILREVGPKEWKALTEAWVFLGQSRLFSLDAGPDGTASARFPSAYRWISSGNSAGLFKLAAELEPSRYKALANFVNDMVQVQKGTYGSALHWDFLQEMLAKSPTGVSAFVQSLQSPDSVDLRTLLTPDERRWIIEFVRSGAFRELWQILTPHLKAQGPKGGLQELKKLLEKRSTHSSLHETFQLLTLVRNDRIKAIARFLLDWEASGELSALVDSLEVLLSGS